MESTAFNQWKKTLVFFRDCKDPLGGEDTFEVGDSRVVTTEAGTYRENAAKVNSRFGYSFTLRCTDKPHLIELVYPDDKPRTICVQDGTCCRAMLSKRFIKPSAADRKNNPNYLLCSR